MKPILTLLFACVLSVSAFAQEPAPNYRYSFRKEIMYATLQEPRDWALQQALRIDRHLANDRLVVAASLGYLYGMGTQKLPDGFQIEGRPRDRFTSDLTVLFDFLNSRRFALRIGGGPSAWYRRDDEITALSYASLPDGKIVSSSAQRTQISALSFGVNVRAEFEADIASRVYVSAQGGRAVFAGNANRRGPSSSLAGFGIGYRF